MTRPLRPAALLALALLPLLASCSQGGGNILTQRPQAPCPRVALTADLVDLTRYRAGAVPDVGTIEVDARMTGANVRCAYAPQNAGLDVTLVVKVEAERGAAAIRSADLPYVVAVTDGEEGNVLSRGRDTVRVTFNGNERRTAALSEEMTVRLFGGVRRASEQVILLGFLLTPEELAANRRRGVR